MDKTDSEKAKNANELKNAALVVCIIAVVGISIVCIMQASHKPSTHLDIASAYPPQHGPWWAPYTEEQLYPMSPDGIRAYWSGEHYIYRSSSGGEFYVTDLAWNIEKTIPINAFAYDNSETLLMVGYLMIPLIMLLLIVLVVRLSAEMDARGTNGRNHN